MSVSFSPAAERDLEDIGDFIALENPRRAVSFIGQIRERCTIIASSPKAAPVRAEIMDGLRVVVHGNYLVFYHILNDEIRIERILHGARDIKRLFE